ncbi:MAG: lytic transglycosylase domain-containing protein [Acidobacteriota bacterium]
MATVSPAGTAVETDTLTALSSETLTVLAELADWAGEHGVVHAPVLVESMLDTPSTPFSVPTPSREQLERLPHGAVIGRVADEHGIDPFLVAAVIEVESNFRTAAISPKGAVGLMQVMPATAPEALRERLCEPEVNLAIGVAYLAKMFERHDYDLDLALAAYNAGPTAVRRWGGVPPYRETERYIEKVTGRYLAHHREAWRPASDEVWVSVIASDDESSTRG